MGIVRYGVHQQLEEAANELIRQSLVGVTSMSEKSDILTPWKEQARRNREVYNPSGIADASLRKGMYHRAWNSRDDHLNSRDGFVRGNRTGSLGDFVEKNTPASVPFNSQLSPTANLGEMGFDAS